MELKQGTEENILAYEEWRNVKHETSAEHGKYGREDKFI